MNYKLILYFVVVIVVGGLSCACQSDQDIAAEDFAREIEIRKKNQSISEQYYLKGISQLENNDMESASQSFGKAVQAYDRNAYAWMALGTIEYQRDRWYEAALAFEKSKNILTTRYEPYYNLGLLLQSLGRYTQAIEHFEIAHELAPDQLEVMESLAQCYVHTNTNLEQARLLIERSLAKESRSQWIKWLEYQRELLSKEH